MVLKVTPRDLEVLAPAGHYIALRIGFAFPMEEINAFPPRWVDHYTKNRLMIHDPVMHWGYTNTGTVRWSELAHKDTRGVLTMGAPFGLKFGLAVAVFDEKLDLGGQRSIASFARSDREFSDLEAKLLHTFIKRRHLEMVAPTNLTAAEIEALGMVRDGLRLKEIAFKLGIPKERSNSASRTLRLSSEQAPVHRPQLWPVSSS
ncbi:autoinducer binding domain-containing protein [Loktanella salsilacus]|uniref:autoinducer binding domain-containing protein n=1 Tax=Loktanella salsilacus TaxID=195913 RepID=UPI003734F5D5